MTPEGWQKVPLDRVAAIQTGIAKGKPVCETLVVSVPYLRVANVQDGRVDLREIKELQVAPEAVMRFSLQSGDVLFTEGGDFDKLGRGCVWRGQIRPCLHQNHVFAVRPHGTHLVPEFLSFYASSPMGKAYFLDCAKQTTNLASINSKQLKSFPIPLPPLPEQRKISAILSSVDEAIEGTQAVIDQLQVVKKAMMAELLTRGIPGRHKKFKMTEIGEVPEGWEVVTLGSLCRKITDGTHQSVTTSASGAVPFLYVSCVREGRILWENSAAVSEEIYVEIAKGRQPEAGSILYTAVGSYGHAAVVPEGKRFTFQRHIAYIVPQFERVRPSFLAGWLNSVGGRDLADRMAVGNAQKTITLGKLREFPVPLPPVDEQGEISSVFSSIDDNIENAGEQIVALRFLKSALMSVLLTGEVRVKT